MTDWTRSLYYKLEERYVADGIRLGTALFECLPSWAGRKVAGTSLDTFDLPLTLDQVFKWLDNHVIFDDSGQIIALFDGDVVIAEKP